MSQVRQARAVQLAPSPSQFRAPLADHCDVVAGFEARGRYQRAASHSAQHMLQLTQAISRIDVDKNQAGLRGRELGDRPFRAVRGPDSDPIARLQAKRQESRRECVGPRLELGVGPPNLLVRDHQRLARSVSRAHFVQQRSDGLADQWRSTVTMYVAFARHWSLPSITKFRTVVSARGSSARPYFPSNTSVGGSMSFSNASAVLAKPRWASAPL